MAGCTGLTATVVFEQYSTIKWLATIAGPIVLGLLLMSRRPATFIAAAVVAAMPFIPLKITLAGNLVSPVIVMLAGGVVVAFASTGRGAQSEGPVRSNPMVRAALAAGLLLFPSALRGLHPSEPLVQAAFVAALGYLVVRVIRIDAKAPMYLLAAFATTAGLQGIIALQEFSSGHQFNPYGNGVATRDASYFFNYEGAFRPAGTFYDPISLGNVLAVWVAMSAVLACADRFPPLLRLWFAATGIAAASGLIVTLSRMSWIAAVVGLALVALLSPGRLRLRQLALCSVAAVVVSGSAVALAGDRILDRFRSILDPTATGVVTANGDEIRQQLWAAARVTFLDHPFTGVGVGNLNAYLVRQVGESSQFSHAHSTYLQNLAESGLLGGLAILALFVGAAFAIGRHLQFTGRLDALALAAAGGIVAVAVTWTTDFAVRYEAVLGLTAVPFILAASLMRPDSDDPTR